MSATKAGFNFRNTSGYVTDGADETYVHNNGVTADEYPTTRSIGGTNWDFGWTNFDGGGPSGADRNASNDRRLAGIHFVAAPASKNFRVTLPQAGDWKFRFAIGDDAAGHTDITVVVKDGASTLFTIGPETTSGANQFVDANGDEYSAANWPANNAQRTATMTGTELNITLSSSTGFGVIAHMEVELDAGGGGDFTLSADPGSYSVTGSAAGVRSARKIAADPGTYTLTGSAASLVYDGADLVAGSIFSSQVIRGRHS